MRAQCEACRAVRRRTMVWGGLPALAFTGAFMYISSPLTVPKLLGPPLCDVVATAVAVAVAAGTRCWGATNRCPPPTAAEVSEMGDRTADNAGGRSGGSTFCKVRDEINRCSIGISIIPSPNSQQLPEFTVACEFGDEINPIDVQ